MAVSPMAGTYKGNEMRDFKVFIRTKSGRSLTITAISTSTVAAMISVTRAMGEMPARITGRPA
jgi:hypothetical protein